MSTIYITKQGATIQKREGQIVVSKGSEIIERLPESKVNAIVMMGNVNLTMPFVSHCLEHAVDVVFLTQAGRFKGRLLGPGARQSERRIRQYDVCRRADLAMEVARAIVGGKIRNQSALVIRNEGSASPALRTLKSMLARSARAQNREELLGCEGAASAAFFARFATWVPKPFLMKGRTANPPRDETNALLSLAYTLIRNRIESHLQLGGLDPFLGFLHQPRNGHAALASDLCEEFRSSLCEPLVLRLLRRRQLATRHFDRSTDGICLTREGLSIFFSEFESKLGSRRVYGGESDVSFREIIKRQVDALARFVDGRTKTYEPFFYKRTEVK